MRRAFLVWLLVLGLGLLILGPGGWVLESRADAARPSRIVSLNPSLTETLLALDAGDKLVGVDDYSARQQTAVSDLPRVGGLFDSNLEAIVALAPDVVVVVPAAQQRDLTQRLGSLGIRVESYPNHRLEDLLTSIESLGTLVGKRDAADARVAKIRNVVQQHRAAVADAQRPRTVMVIQRDPLFVVGGGSYLHELLDVAGANNVAAEFGEAYPRVGLEWLLEAAPQVILDASPDPEAAATYWARWPSLPAVGNQRVVVLPASAWRPGPFIDASLNALARALNPAASSVAESASEVAP